MRFASFLAIAALSLPAAGADEAITGNTLHEWAKPTSRTQYGIALGMVAGVMATERMYTEFFRRRLLDTEAYKAIPTENLPALLCIPGSVTNGQALAVVAKDLDEHPATRHDEAFVCIRRALARVWPCPDK